MHTPFDPLTHHRCSIRLKGYDDASAGAYFVTLVASNRESLFGWVENGETQLNEAGAMLGQWWAELPRKFQGVETGEFVIMPNLCHGIIVITVGADLRVCPGWRPNSFFPDSRPRISKPAVGRTAG